MKSQPPFVPANELESHLLQAQLGQSSIAEFLDKLLAAEVFVLVDKDPGTGGLWDNAVSPLVLANAAGLPVFPMFTSQERFTLWHKQFPKFKYWTLVPFQSLLRGIADDVGIVLNPGKTVDLELAPEAVANLKARLQAGAAAT